MTDSEETREEESKPEKKRLVIEMADLAGQLPEGRQIDQIRIPGGKWHDLKEPVVGRKKVDEEE